MKPLEAKHLPEIDSTAANAAARAIEALVEPPLILERLIVSEGSAEHDCNGAKWSENTRRVHVAIARPPIRAIVDLAGFSLEVVERVVGALRRAGSEREAPRHVRLAPHVGAALLPSLVGAEDLEQAAAAHDGKGRPIERRRVSKSQPPIWFRPSYRARPVRAWFHLRAIHRGQVDLRSVIRPPAGPGVALLLPCGRVVAFGYGRPPVGDKARQHLLDAGHLRLVYLG